MVERKTETNYNIQYPVYSNMGTSGYFYISGDTFSWQDSENSKRTVTVGDIVVRMPDGTIEINPLPIPTKSTM